LTGNGGGGGAAGESEPTSTPATLTDREMQVLRLLATGSAAKQVAAQLGCSVSTVHNHLHHVYRKLNVTGQTQALLMAREMGWV
jgi:DNA-binding NarL/FixJ family response regulator